MMRRSILLLALLASAPVLSQEARGPYVGLGIAQMNYKTSFLIWFDVDEVETVPRLFAGFRPNEKMAFEAVYTGKADYAARMSGHVPNFLDSNGNVGGGNYVANYTGSFDSLELRILAHAGNFVFGTGIFSSDFSGRLIGSTPPIGPYDGNFEGRIDDSDTGFMLIIGGQFDIGNWGIRPEYEYFDAASPGSASSLGVQFSYRFQ